MVVETRNLFVWMTAVFLLLMVVSVQATPDERVALTLDQRSSNLHLQKMQPLLGPQFAWTDVYEDPFGGFEELDVGEQKSTRRAFLYSLLIPGAGQIYTKSNIIKPILFLGIEVAGIMGYLNFHGKGEDRRDVYQAYADEHWFYDGRYVMKYDDGAITDSAYHGGYLGSLEDQYPSGEWCFGDTAKWYDSGDNKWKNTFAEHLNVVVNVEDSSSVAVKDHAYYENIGKYPQFQFGWDDFPYPQPDSLVNNKDYRSPHRNTYVKLRKDANDEFSKATKMLFLTMANHLVSAFDAALSARRFNRKHEQLTEVSIKMRYVMHYGKPMPKLTMTLRY